ncbi:MAG: type II secretion system F family protein [Cetobacterium sp.]
MILNKELKEKDLKKFYKKTGRLLNAGISLKNAIEFQKNSSKDKNFNFKILNISKRLEKGEDIYSILKNENFIKERELLIIYVSENSGKIGDGFLKIAHLKEKKEKLNNEIKTALSYPVFILVVSTIILGLIFYLVVPNFEDLYSMNKNELPQITRIILSIKNILTKYPHLVFLSLFFILFSLKMKFVRKKIYKIPFIRFFFIQKHIISILDNLSILLDSGVSIDKSIDIILENLDSGFFKNKIYILKNIQKGESLSSCFKKVNLLTLEEIDMIKIGEQCGTTEIILKEIGSNRDEELKIKIKIILKLIEPVLLLIVGVIISIFVVGLYLPILNMTNLLDI